jgi:hypothetical protein
LVGAKIGEIGRNITDRPEAQAPPAAQPQVVQTKICRNGYLGLNVAIPDNWSCFSSSVNVVGVMTVNNDFFKISFSNEGGHGLCDLDKSKDKCTIKELYRNDVLILNEHYDFTQNIRELRGNILNYTVNVHPSYPSNPVTILVTYTNMNARSLTSDELDQLKNVLDTVRVTKS